MTEQARTQSGAGASSQHAAHSNMGTRNMQEGAPRRTTQPAAASAPEATTTARPPVLRTFDLLQAIASSSQAAATALPTAGRAFIALHPAASAIEATTSTVPLHGGSFVALQPVASAQSTQPGSTQRALASRIIPPTLSASTPAGPGCEGVQKLLLAAGQLENEDAQMLAAAQVEEGGRGAAAAKPEGPVPSSAAGQLESRGGWSASGQGRAEGDVSAVPAGTQQVQQQQPRQQQLVLQGQQLHQQLGRTNLASKAQVGGRPPASAVSGQPGTTKNLEKKYHPNRFQLYKRNMDEVTKKRLKAFTLRLTEHRKGSHDFMQGMRMRYWPPNGVPGPAKVVHLVVDVRNPRDAGIGHDVRCFIPASELPEGVAVEDNMKHHFRLHYEREDDPLPLLTVSLGPQTSQPEPSAQPQAPPVLPITAVRSPGSAASAPEAKRSRTSSGPNSPPTSPAKGVDGTSSAHDPSSSATTSTAAASLVGTEAPQRPVPALQPADRVATGLQAQASGVALPALPEGDTWADVVEGLRRVLTAMRADKAVVGRWWRWVATAGQLEVKDWFDIFKLQWRACASRAGREVVDITFSHMDARLGKLPQPAGGLVPTACGQEVPPPSLPTPPATADARSLRKYITAALTVLSSTGYLTGDDIMLITAPMLLDRVGLGTMQACAKQLALSWEQKDGDSMLWALLAVVGCLEQQ